MFLAYTKLFHDLFHETLVDIGESLVIFNLQLVQSQDGFCLKK